MGLLAFALAMGSTCLVSGTLCVGEDGHVAVEPTRGGRCGGSEHANEAPAAFEAASGLRAAGPGSHCGPCVDLTGVSGEWLAGAKLPQADPGPAFAAATAPSGAPWPQSPPVLAAPTGRALPAHPLLRATVLRC